MQVWSPGHRWPLRMVTARRLVAFASITITILSACTSHVAHEPNAERDLASEQEPPFVNSNEDVAWRWIHDVEPKLIHAGSFVCAFTHDDQVHDAGKVCCEGPDKRWCATMREDFVPGIALASDGQRLFVADYPAIASGARFAAYELQSGAMVWSREAIAIGPQQHSQYSNVVQLRLIGDALIAYGDEAHGAYVETMDPATGVLREHATLDRPQVQWSWSESLPEPDRAQVSDGQRLVEVTWSRIANGARARAWALADGRLLWDREIEGIGPQDHSKYSNQIQLGLEGGLVIVRGQESHGRYVEALDVATGALRWTVSWPD
jgi:hypothetical protein